MSKHPIADLLLKTKLLSTELLVLLVKDSTAPQLVVGVAKVSAAQPLTARLLLLPPWNIV
jgi:hypothetical protein